MSLILTISFPVRQVAFKPIKAMNEYRIYRQCTHVQTDRSTKIKQTNMIIKSIFIQIMFWWSLSTMVGCIPVEEPSERRITIDSVPLPDIPMASEESVHMLTAVRFPPPALFFANPDKKWSLDDFEKSDQATTYSVTDDMSETQDQQDSYPQQDLATTLEPETQTEVETTTIGAAVGELVNRLQQTASDGHVESLRPTGDGHTESHQPIGDGLVESLRPTGDGHAESHQPIGDGLVESLRPTGDGHAESHQHTSDGLVESLRPTGDGHTESHQPTGDKLVESLQPARDRLSSSRPTTVDRLIVTSKQQQLPVHNAKQRPADRWSEKRWTTSRDRLRRPVASENDRSPIRTIVLTSRPLPVPGADVRFPDVEYAVARLGERKNLHDFHRQ
ncbi:uncharacterized protein LOC113552557 [Rhopalosiphum maidis]|uniref:uncharacterized protein LOC113552557 n=1 Tax=Rhopalosiphum maidis TaxID=43146 RepID=UPI000EFF5F72|nr:uncharacterized protein LOC113552557 [Rhopalosiphum maidis]